MTRAGEVKVSDFCNAVVSAGAPGLVSKCPDVSLSSRARTTRAAKIKIREKIHNPLPRK